MVAVAVAVGVDLGDAEKVPVAVGVAAASVSEPHAAAAIAMAASRHTRATRLAIESMPRNSMPSPISARADNTQAEGGHKPGVAGVERWW